MAWRSKTGGKASNADARKASPARGRKSVKTKGRIAPAAKPRKPSLVADLKARLELRTQEAEEFRQQQSATADILKVIASSSSDTTPVFEAIASSAKRLLGGFSTAVFRVIDDTVHLGAFTPVSPVADAALQADFPQPVENFEAFRLAQHGKPIAIADTEEVSHARLRDIARLHGFRSMLWVPTVNGGVTIGIISVTRAEPGAFAPNHIQLLQTFADQAVIAIENTRLFNEVQERTRDLTESLEQQTATSEVLEVISASTGELKPVFQKMLENATRVCGAQFGVMNLGDGTKFELVADYNVPPAFLALRKNMSVTRDATPSFEMIVKTHRVVQIDDVRTSPGYLAGAPLAVGIADLASARTMIVVPMLKEDALLGFIMIYRTEVKPFTEKQVALLENFTKQAVIAIENVRLLNELRQRTSDLSESLEQQTATSEVLGVISRSAGDLEKVFHSMLDNATRICGAQFGLMNLYEGDNFRTVASHNAPPEFLSARKESFRPRADSILAQLVRTRQFVHTPDLSASTLYAEGDPPTRNLVDLAGARTILVVPMRKDNELVGTIGIYRREVSPFNDKQIALLSSFASQAVIAIENTRLLKELRQRTGDLSQSLDELRTAQDRLVQTEKLASLGQLTAGIAHEIKNPLNFVNNFAALSAELTDELSDTLRPEPLSEKARHEVNELTGLLKDNLEKVVQHGKRADSIVKNMLLHSREGTGERRSADINAIVEESLNLAYHGARAEKPGFHITLSYDLDPHAGEIDLYPQEITRALLNLISNGFYAATKRKSEAGNEIFEPALNAATTNLFNRVEIRIRDNGTGIPAEVKEKMFNPFFTTKPAGEGTGLGLSMSHDIIVKQHGGTIDVETEPGQFTEFKIVLPRTSHIQDRKRDQT